MIVTNVWQGAFMFIALVCVVAAFFLGVAWVVRKIISEGGGVDGEN